MTHATETVRVAIPRPLHALFDYSVPDALAGPVVGARVIVPFGRQRLTAICVGQNPTDVHPRLKPISAVLDSENAFGNELYELALWLAEYYHHPLGEVLGTILPVAARREAKFIIHHPETWQRTEKPADITRAPKQQALIDYIEAEGGVLEAAQLRAAGLTRTIIRAVAGKGLIVATEPAPALEQLATPGVGECETAIADFIEATGEAFDVVLIDTPPNTNVATTWAALAATHYVISPVPADAFGTQSIISVQRIVEQVTTVNPAVRILGYVLNQVQRNGVNDAYVQTVRQLHGSQVFTTELPLAVAFREAMAVRMPLAQYKPRVKAAKLIGKLADEIDERISATDARRAA